MNTKQKIALAAAAIVAVAFSVPDGDINNGLATVNKVDGYYIFMQCTPVAPYEILGTVKKTGIAISGDPDEMFKTILRRAKKDFPKCDAIIFTDVAMKHGDCIVFK